MIKKLKVLTLFFDNLLKELLKIINPGVKFQTHDSNFVTKIFLPLDCRCNIY